MSRPLTLGRFIEQMEDALYSRCHEPEAMDVTHVGTYRGVATVAVAFSDGSLFKVQIESAANAAKRDAKRGKP